MFQLWRSSLLCFYTFRCLFFIWYPLLLIFSPIKQLFAIFCLRSLFHPLYMLLLNPSSKSRELTCKKYDYRNSEFTLFNHVALLTARIYTCMCIISDLVSNRWNILNNSPPPPPKELCHYQTIQELVYPWVILIPVLLSTTQSWVCHWPSLKLIRSYSLESEWKSRASSS